MVYRWTKIHQLGSRETLGIFDDECSWTEKLDGSQFNWGVSSEFGLEMKSKKADVELGNNKLFDPGSAHITAIADEGLLKTDWSYHGETLCCPGHGTMVYDRVPLNHVALYGVTKEDGTQVTNHDELASIAASLRIDVVPEVFRGKIDPKDAISKLDELLKMKSYLGGKGNIEGVVIKNYHRQVIYGGMALPLVQAKYVSEEFKELHKVAWPTNNKAPIQIVGEMVRTQARYDKAIIHLKESGGYTDSVKDIGPIMKLLHQDIQEEDNETIKNMLWSAFKKDILRAGTRGIPEYYKKRLIDPTYTLTQFDEDRKGEWLVDGKE